MGFQELLVGVQTGIMESMAEAGKSVSDYLGNGEKIIYINVLNNISIDQASNDLAFAAEGSESLQRRVNDRDGLHTLEHAQRVCLYQLLFYGTASTDCILLDIGHGDRLFGICFCKRCNLH